MKPQFDFYLRILHRPNCAVKSTGITAAPASPDRLENFGLPNCTEWGWKRPADFDKGVEYNAWLEYEWDTALEFCLMILETERYNGNNIKEYIPLIESCLRFFNEHYQYLASKRGRNKLDGKGQLVIFPGSAAETYKMAYNRQQYGFRLAYRIDKITGIACAIPYRYITDSMATDAVAHSAYQLQTIWYYTRLLRRPNCGNGSTIQNAPSYILFSHGVSMVLANRV